VTPPLKKILIEPHVQSFTENFLSKQAKFSLCFSAKFKGRFSLLDLHLSDRIVLGPEAETAFTFVGL
jgi:hypothetical protein